MDIVDPDRPYPMHRPRLGHAVIVNNVSSEMPGSNSDVTALKAAYEAVGFDVQIHTDCNGQQMRSIKKFIMAEDSHTDSNCFSLTIICHGNDKGQLLDRDRKKAWDTELFIGELSDVETLAGKPKIMVIQSCRGTQMSTGREVHYLAEVDERETTNILPDKADMFLAYATVPGFRAHGGDENGSIYLQALATYLQQEFMDRPLNKILQMVRQYMVRKDQDCKDMRQCPEERNSLIYDVMFSEYHKRNPSRPAVTAHPHQPSAGHSGKGSTAGYTTGYSDKGSAAGYSGKGQAPVPHSRGGVQQPAVDHIGVYHPGNGVPSSSEDRMSQQMGRLTTTDTFGTGGPVTLSLTFTYKTDLKEASSFTVLDGGVVVVCGRARRGPWAYYTYSKQYNESHASHYVTKVYLMSDRRVSCKHEVHMLPYGPDYQVLTSCEWCKKLRRVNLGAPDQAAPGSVYSGEELWPGRLCEGETPRTLVYSLGKILEFGVHFSAGPMKTIDTGLSNCIGMCYVGPLKVAVLSDGSGGVIRAVACEDGPRRGDPRVGDVLWEVKGIVDGVKCDPHGVIYLPAPRDILLVCDGSNTRLLVLDPSTGNHRQSIGLPETMGEVQDLCYHSNDELVVLHNADNLFNISFFSMKVM